MRQFEYSLLIGIFLALTFLSGSCEKEVVEPPIIEPPKMSISSVTLFEGNENSVFRFQVSTSKAIEQEVKVNFATEEITAGDGSDFYGRSGTVVVPVNERKVFIDIEIIADTLREADEQFKIVLSNPVNATLQLSEGIGTIRNDDTYINIPDDGYITPDSYVGYGLSWQDEFEGTEINTSDWTHETGAGGWGNQERQNYTTRSENSYLTDGNLVIEAKEEPFEGAPYTSARMITRNKQEFQYGRVDIRAILPEGQGIWPALWMLGANHSEIGWPACGEIDIMELIGHEPSTVHGTAHWGEQGQSSSVHKGAPYSINGEKFSDKYHVFSIIWEPNSIKWYVDDNQYYSLSSADVNGNYPFNDKFFFIFNIAVGGQWPGYPDETTIFPQRMYVDYIRVFQKN